MEYKEINISSLAEIPSNFTGVANFPYEKVWFKEGKWHKTDGPAVELADGTKEWHIESRMYAPGKLESLFKDSIYLEKKKGNYNLEWLSFLTKEGIEEFPIIPGMKETKEFSKMFNQLGLSV
jgi:hypothetical protein